MRVDFGFDFNPPEKFGLVSGQAQTRPVDTPIHARASKLATVGGCLMRFERKAITMPSESRATTPKPTKSVSMKVAPSKFTL